MKNLSELRIGNFVHANNEIRKINGVIRYGLYFDYGYCPNQKDWIKPIELTEEWLLKCNEYVKWQWFGTENYGGYIDFVGDWKLMIRYWKDGFLFEVVTVDKKHDLYRGVKKLKLKIKYVHQLQNFYQTFTLKELTIKENETTKS